MTRRTLWSLSAIAAACCGQFAAAQSTITRWNFNSNPGDGNTATGTFTPAFGAGTSQCYNNPGFAALTECIFASGTGSTDPETADDSGWQTRGYPTTVAGAGQVGAEFAVNTTNYSNIIVSWDQRHSNSSSRYSALYYSTDGLTFTQVPGLPYEGNLGDVWFSRTFDFSAIPAVANNPNFKFRISTALDPATGNSYTPSNTGSTFAGTGTYRFDMVTVSGTALVSIPPQGVAVAAPAAVCAGGGQVTLRVTVTPGINPVSTGLAVVADLTTVGGLANTQLFDNATNGDLVAGDNIFTLSYTVPGSVTVGLKNAPITVSDAEPRSTNTSLSFSVADCAQNAPSQVVISQVYGGGANAGPPVGIYDADFVELYNRSPTTVDLTNWSVQYASGGSLSGFDNALDRVQLSGLIRPGQYLLVRMSTPGTLGSPLPAPDFTGSGGMGNNAGRVALVRSTTLIGTNCADLSVEDLASYGGAICFEGAAPALATANDSGITRKLGGAQDTNQNFNDFSVATPSPRNRASGGFLAGYGSIDTAATCAGSTVNFSVNVFPGAAPPSTMIQVRADLTTFDGSATQSLIDAGGGLFTLGYPIPVSVTQGLKTIPLTVTDAQGRTDSSRLFLDVATCTNSPARVVISGFFGGGGNTGAPFNADHVEIFNRSAAPVDLTGWSLQYANTNSAAGFLISQTVPLSGTINPGTYRLIQTSAVGVNGAGIPTPDFTALPFFGMDNSSGRIALVRIATPLAGDCASVEIEDLVGYGLSASCFEGIGTTPDISNTVGGYRKLDGCQDNNQNSIDFVILSPLNLPRNSASPANPCVVIPVNGACCCGSNCSITTAAACIGTNRSFAGIGTVCTPFSYQAPCCRGDYNKSGSPTSVQDIFDFLSGYFSADSCADTNDTGGANTVQDIFDFLSAYFGGC